MKNKLLILPILVINVIGLSSCNKEPEKFKISFGSLIDTSYTDINYADLSQKINYKENMIVATYPGKDTTCSCWRTFEYVLEDYVKTNEAIIYAIDVFEIIGKSNEFNLTLSKVDPSIAFFKEGKLVKQVVYSVVNTPSFFKNSLDFVNFINENVTQPDLLYVDQNVLNTAKENDEDYIIAHTYSDCSDCTYVLPNVLMPYTNANSLETKIWVIDLNDVHADNVAWVAYKDTNFLSNVNNQTLGYGAGYVPTFQYYENGELVSSSVFFNDTVTKVDDKFIVSQSFYSEERKQYLAYADSVTNNVLVGLELNEDDVTEYPEYDVIIWNHESARQYHEPLLKAFLDLYAK